MMSRPALRTSGAAAVVAGAIGVGLWVVLCSITNPPSPVWAVAVGLLVGYAAGSVPTSGGWPVAIVACVAAAVSLMIGFYYVDRLGFIEVERAANRSLSLPLVPPWAWYWHVINQGFHRWILQTPYLLGGIAAAGWSAFRGFGQQVMAGRAGRADGPTQ